MKVNIAWLDQHGYWQHYGQMNHLPNARKTAEMLAARKTEKSDSPVVTVLCWILLLC